MPPIRPYTPAKVTKNAKVTLNLGPVYNIIVIVAGTSDPGNMSLEQRSNSYEAAKPPAGEDPNWYWETNPVFRDDLKKLVDENKKYNVALFSAHGWTGDNAVKNREVSGGYLVDRLCGSNGEKPYYQKYLKNEVWFHLIGHSHGGNVINEMTKRMAVCEEWPAMWKVKTLVYLSTPFFNKLHQLNAAKLHPGGRVVNVFNKYDLTQRTIANFSLVQLPGAATATEAAMSELPPLVKKLTSFNTTALANGLRSIRLRDFDDRPWHTDWTWAMDPERGAAMYDACLTLFKNLEELLDKVKEIVSSLSKEVEHKVAKGLEGKVSNKHRMISEALKKRFVRQLDTVKDGLTPTIQAFERRLRGTRYPVSGLIEDLFLNRFLRPLVDLIAVNAPGEDGRLSNPPAPANSILDLLHDLLAEQIDQFDDTKNTPVHQLAKTAFKDKLHHVEVTSKDRYFRQRDAQFNRFITYLEAVEARYQTSRSKADLVDMIFTLIAQLEFVQSSTGWLDGIINALTAADWSNVGDDAFDQLVEDLLQTMRNYRAILQRRNFGGIVVTTDTDEPKRGDLSYLMLVSHSVSRQAVYSEVAAVLRAQFKP